MTDPTTRLPDDEEWEADDEPADYETDDTTSPLDTGDQG